MSPEGKSNHNARVFQINVSDGGVPKLGIHQADITHLGVTGDRQRDLKNHGGPERAVCLFSLEHILALQGEGHSLFPGAAGENLTLVGVDWDQIKPGSRLQLGAQVLIEITQYTVPCGNLRSYFKDGQVARIDQEKHPGWSRVYARVLVEGQVMTGDLVRLI